MPITYPLTLPAGISTKRIRFGMQDTVARARSPYSAKSQKQVYPANLWSAEVQFPGGMKRSQGAKLIAFLAALRGAEGSFLLGDPDGATPQGNIAGATPVCNGAAAAGSRTISLRGWPASQVGALKPGDYLQLGTGTTQRLYMYCGQSDLNANGSGVLTSVDLWPVLREATVDGQAVTLTNTKGVFELAENLREWDLDEVLTYGVSLRAVESL